jgi:hypothetical protein
MTDKRGLVLILVITTVVIFVGIVWVIATYLPLGLATSPNPTFTADTPRVAINCAAPVAYWAQHPELYPAQLVIGGQIYKGHELAKIFSGQADDLTARLQAQLTGAYLNISSGADQSYIETTIFEAYTWLVQHPEGSQVLGGDQEEGTRLFTLLEAYNRGLTGVKPCAIAGLISTEPRTSTETATETITVTPIPTDAPQASETATSTNFPTEPIYTVSVPSNTPSPTIKATQRPQPTRTKPPAPTATLAPTNTPKPPTPTLPPPPPTLPQPTPTLP